MKSPISLPADNVARHDADAVTSKLNEVAGTMDTSLDRFVEAATYEVLKRSKVLSRD